MRTTLTLDPDVAALLEQEVHRQRKSLKQVVNDALRRSLSGQAKRPKLEPYRTVPHQAQLMPGIDRGHFNRLADELEDEAILAKFRKK
jgi:hypothetical protein